MSLRIVGILLCFSIWVQVNGQKTQAHDLKREADRAYDKSEFERAEEAYRRAGILNPEAQSHFNLGNSILKQQRYDDAAREYEKAIGGLSTPEEKSKAWYNLGNAHYLKGNFDESIQAYKNSLILQPRDMEAKQNLLMALQARQRQEQEQQQQQEKQESEENQNDPASNPPQEKNQNPQASEENQDPDETQQAQGETESTLSKEEALQLLKIIDEEDQRVQEKLRKKEAIGKKTNKDW